MRDIKVKTIWIFFTTLLLIAATIATYIYFRPYQFGGFGVVVQLAFSQKAEEKLIDNKFVQGFITKEKLYQLSTPDRIYYLFLSEINEEIRVKFEDGIILKKYLEQLNIVEDVELASSRPIINDDFNGLLISYRSNKRLLSGQVFLTRRAIVGAFVLEKGRNISREAKVFLDSLDVREATELNEVF